MNDTMAALYQDEILRHSRAPLHAHRPARVDGQGAGNNPLCGDCVEVFVCRDHQGCMTELGFEAQGCAISLASADMMAELLRGADASEARRLFEGFSALVATGQTGSAALEPLRAFANMRDYPSRHRCAMLPWEALLAALGEEARDDHR